MNLFEATAVFESRKAVCNCALGHHRGNGRPAHQKGQPAGAILPAVMALVRHVCGTFHLHGLPSEWLIKQHRHAIDHREVRAGGVYFCRAFSTWILSRELRADEITALV